MADVVVVGAGPTGLTLACELLRGGVSVRLLDSAQGRSDASRAAVMHARTMEIFDQRGMFEAFGAVGRPGHDGHFAGLPLDLSLLPTNRPYALGIMQTQTERVLDRFLNDLGASVQWETEVVAVEQDDGSAAVTTSGPDGAETHRARYVVGCDGGRSAVRSLAGIGFDGTSPKRMTMFGDVEFGTPPAGRPYLERRSAGTLSVVPFGELTGETWRRVVVTEYDAAPGDSDPLRMEDLCAALERVAGTDFGIHSPRWLSRFGDASKQAIRYRSGRVFVAGDAAHVHPPLGGQGMNLGIQDAANLGWKLAAVVRGDAPEDLLDSYHDERHPVAARVVKNTRAQAALLEPGVDVTAMREMLGGMLTFDNVNERVGAEISGLDVNYGEDLGHPIVGRRIPDCDIVIGSQSSRLYELLHDARPVLIDFGANLDVDLAPVVQRVSASCPVRTWRLPVVGRVPVPSAVLVRPDGYVAWACLDDTTAGLERAAERIGGVHRSAERRHAARN